MNFLLKFFKYFFILSILALLQACGSGDGGKLSKGHRDSIKAECKDSSDIKACGLEVRGNFLEDGNEFVTFEDLTKEQARKIKLECMRSKKFGLEAYNNCLDDYRTAALDGTLFTTTIAQKPTSNIDKLKLSTVLVGVIEKRSDNKTYLVGSGSGVVISDKLIATNCHVAFVVKEKPNRWLEIKSVGEEVYAEVKIYKEKTENDICILKKVLDSEFKFDMNPVPKLKKFSKLSEGDFVRSVGSPGGADKDSTAIFEGHTAEGSINYLGTAGQAQWSWCEDLSPDTKIIVHSATISYGSSGGPLFDKNGYLIGINSSGDDKFNISVSADHIKEALKD